MITFVTALNAEAAPLIDRYNLIHTNDPFFPVYRYKNRELIVTGMGPLNSATATAYILAQNTGQSRAIVNIGTCATAKSEDPIAKMYLIHKIIDTMTNKVYHLPKREGSLPEGTVWTYARAQDKIESKTHLVDMESSGFYTAATKFLSKEQIYLFKVVSDFGDITPPDAKSTKNLIARNLPLMEEYFSI